LEKEWINYKNGWRNGDVFALVFLIFDLKDIYK